MWNKMTELLMKMYKYNNHAKMLLLYIRGSVTFNKNLVCFVKKGKHRKTKRYKPLLMESFIYFENQKNWFIIFGRNKFKLSINHQDIKAVYRLEHLKNKRKVRYHYLPNGTTGQRM